MQVDAAYKYLETVVEPFICCRSTQSIEHKIRLAIQVAAAVECASKYANQHASIKFLLIMPVMREALDLASAVKFANPEKYDQLIQQAKVEYASTIAASTNDTNDTSTVASTD
jgi:hypothetical protein